MLHLAADFGGAENFDAFAAVPEELLVEVEARCNAVLEDGVVFGGFHFLLGFVDG